MIGLMLSLPRNSKSLLCNKKITETEKDVRNYRKKY